MGKIDQLSNEICASAAFPKSGTDGFKKDFCQFDFHRHMSPWAAGTIKPEVEMLIVL